MFEPMLNAGLTFWQLTEITTVFILIVIALVVTVFMFAAIVVGFFSDVLLAWARRRTEREVAKFNVERRRGND